MAPGPIERVGRVIDQRTDPVRGDGRGWLLLTVAAGWFLTLGIRFAFPALLPGIKDTFSVQNTAVGFAVTLSWLAYASIQLPAGAFIDRLGERVLLSWSLILGGASLTLFLLSPSFEFFLVAAAIFGVATGVYGPSRGTVLSNNFTRGAGAAFGITLAAGSIGSAAMPFVATQVSVRTNWQIAMTMFVPVFLAVAVGVWWAVPENQAPENDDRDWGETFRAIRGVAAQSGTVLAVAGVTILRFTFQGLTAFFTTYLVELKGLTQGMAGGLFALLFVAGAVFQLIAGRAVDTFGHRRVLIAVVALNIPPLIALPYVDGVVPLTVVAALLGVRLAMGPASNPYIIGALPSAVQGTTWGLIRTVFFAVGATGSVAVGIVADAGMFDGAMFGLAGLTLLAGVLFVLLPERSTDETA